MRYYVAACFNAEAAGIFLSSSTDENSAVLVADDCVVELRIRVQEGASDLAKSASLILEAMPWDSARMRLRVNGISYGTGPLVLRDRDLVTLQPIISSDLKADEGYTYSVTALPDADNSSTNSVSPPFSGAEKNTENKQPCSPLRDEDRRPYTIAANMAEYAKWNNFYGDRFGSSAIHAAALPGLLSSDQTLQKCSCGCYLPHDEITDRRATLAGSEAHPMARGSVQGHGATCASLPSAMQGTSRMLVTVFPSIPTLLSIDDGAEECPTVHFPAVVSCCACPFLHPAHPRRGEIKVLRTSGDRASNAPPSSGDADKAAALNEENTNTKRPDKSSAKPATSTSAASAWETYAAARKKDLQLTNTTFPASESKKGTNTPQAPLDRSSAALLLRIATLESAMMGSWYE